MTLDLVASRISPGTLSRFLLFVATALPAPRIPLGIVGEHADSVTVSTGVSAHQFCPARNLLCNLTGQCLYSVVRFFKISVGSNLSKVRQKHQVKEPGVREVVGLIPVL